MFLLLHFVSIAFVSGHLEFTLVDLWIFVGRPHALTGSLDEKSCSSNRIFGTNIFHRIGPNVTDGKIGQGVGVRSRPASSRQCAAMDWECSFVRHVRFDLGVSWWPSTQSKRSNRARIFTLRNVPSSKMYILFGVEDLIMPFAVLL